MPFCIGEKGCGVLVTNLDCHSLLDKIRVFVYYYYCCYYYIWVLEKGFSSLFNILFVVVVVVVSWQVMGVVLVLSKYP